MAAPAAGAQIELAATPAWHGWSRPGRTTEIDIRASTTTAVRARIDVVSGRQSVQTDVELQPGRTLRLQLPVGPAERIGISATPPSGPATRQEVVLALSESPLLGVSVAAGEPIALGGFHTIALDADDLPRSLSAYAVIDALVLDADTLARLDPRQRAALQDHAAACGRIAVVDADTSVHRWLDGAGGCGGRALVRATTASEAGDRLAASLAQALTPQVTLGSAGALAQPDSTVWQRVTVGLAVYLAAAALLLAFSAGLPLWVLTAGGAGVLALVLLHGLQPPSRLVVWSEAQSGAQAASYQAWQRFSGVARQHSRVPVPPQLASTVRSCDNQQAAHFEVDAGSGRTTSATLDTRLFSQAWLCSAGSFPITRSLVLQADRDGGHRLHNGGAKTWPEGTLLVAGRSHELPALEPGASTLLAERDGRPPRGGAQRLAMSRTPPDGAAALWALDLGGVADAPISSAAWLLVTVSAP